MHTDRFRLLLALDARCSPPARRSTCAGRRRAGPHPEPPQADRSACIEDPATDAETRRKLDLVLQARTFAEQAVGLERRRELHDVLVGGSDTLLLVVSAPARTASRRTPGGSPSSAACRTRASSTSTLATAEAARLEAAGYDAYVRPAGAFSTLGWFNDPLLNTLLRYDDVTSSAR
jgi:predicted aminopeptidase